MACHSVTKNKRDISQRSLQHHGMNHWEYKVLKLETESGFFSGTEFDSVELEKELNRLGAEGWELVSVFSIEKVKGGSKYVNATLKRPLS